MQIIETAIPEIKLIIPRVFDDLRGFLLETYHRSRLHESNVDIDFVQDNHSFSAQSGTVRGLHFQIPPVAQAKLVYVVHGAILDVAVDIRIGSPTFGKHVTAVLDEENHHQLFIPCGFAHGFATLKPETHVYYKLSTPFALDHAHGLRWNDPELEIDWKIDPTAAILSEQDRQHPALSEIPEYFTYADGMC